MCPATLSLSRHDATATLSDERLDTREADLAETQRQLELPGMMLLGTAAEG